MYNDWSQSYLESTLDTHKYIIESSALLSPHFKIFLETAKPFIDRYQKPVYIFRETLNEIKQEGSNGKNAFDLVNQEVKRNHIIILKAKPDNDCTYDAKTLHLVRIAKLRTKAQVVVLTQNKKFALQIAQCNNGLCTPTVTPLQLCADRLLTYKYSIRLRKKASVENSIIAVTHTPREGDNVYIDNQCITLGQKIGEGGEGAIHAIDQNRVAKIYKNDSITTLRKAKLELLIQKDIHIPGVCTPQALVYNRHGEFVGYTMEKADGVEIQRSLFHKVLFQKRFPTWTKRELVQLCITILKKINGLHKRGILIGDINPANILVKDEQNVYFVDTDSYQVDGIPCTVGCITFTAPEIQFRRFAEFLRSKEDEHFALATLLFMLMLPGKSPYSQLGGTSMIDNILRRDFSYPLGEERNDKAPEGPWRFIWSHMPYHVREAFYETFRIDGKYNNPECRLSPEDWFKILVKYDKSFNSLVAKDAMSADIFPTRFRKNSAKNYIRCKICQQEMDKRQCKNGICTPCLREGTIISCKNCEQKFLYTNYEKYIKKFPRSVYCEECRKQIAENRQCIACGNYFSLSFGEVEFYNDKGFELPRRCLNCRENGNQPVYSPLPPARPRHVNEPSDSGSWCFITTAMCQFAGKSDDCTELQTFRRFRDEWLSQQPGGTAQIEEYYRIAPDIVRFICESDSYEALCRMIIKHYLHPCYKMLLSGRFEECRTLYTKMVHDLNKTRHDHLSNKQTQNNYV